MSTCQSGKYPGFDSDTLGLIVWGNKYKDYVQIFRDQILCPLNGGVPKRGWSITLFAQLNQHGWGCYHIYTAWGNGSTKFWFFFQV